MYSGAGNVSSSSSAAAGNSAASHAILLHHRQVQHPLMIQLPPAPSPQPYITGDADDDEFPRKDERFPHWGNQETRDLIEIRAQLEGDFTAAPRRNKNLWEMVASRMREKGHRRTSEQCKCKWKTLVNRYKGHEASDDGRQSPFFEELNAVFTARANRMHQAQLEAEAGNSKGRKRDQSHEEISEEQAEEEEIEVNQAGKGRNVQRRRPGKEKLQKVGEMDNELIQSRTHATNKHGSFIDGLKVIMKNFIQQQQIIDLQWRESMQKRAEEREIFEQEWRLKMEKLEQERLMMEQAWREKEEQRRLREESRAEKRDALLTMLLNKLIGEEGA